MCTKILLIFLIPRVVGQGQIRPEWDAPIRDNNLIHAEVIFVRDFQT